MKFGLIQFYPWRPHIEHMMVLAESLINDGHSVFFLTCDGNVEMCYQHLLKSKRSRSLVCLQCRFSGVRSYYSKNISSLSNNISKDINPEVRNLSSSSAYTILRIEDDSEKDSEKVEAIRKSLTDGCNKSYSSTKSLIQDNNLDGLLLFNARMDMLAAAAKAAKDLDVPYVSLERSISNKGIMLKYNENCLGLSCLQEMLQDYQDKFLTEQQCNYALMHAASRFIGKNKHEYKIFNKNRKKAIWPIDTQRKRVLITPSSCCEFMGDEQHDVSMDIFELVDLVLKKLELDYSDCLLREHPNWGTVFSDGSTNTSAKRFWRDWCRKHGVMYIKAESNLSTYDLLQECDILFCNGSSTAKEAGVCGKNIICFGPSTYLGSGFVNTVTKPDDISRVKILSNDTIVRKCLRYIYTIDVRFPQFSSEIIPENNMSFTYDGILSSEVIVNIFKNKIISSSDLDFSNSPNAEDYAIELLKGSNWENIYDSFVSQESKILYKRKVKRRFFFRWVDFISRFKKTSTTNH